jgi:hypothetical protein
MSRFVELATARVELGGGDWVELRTRLRYGDRAAIEERLLGLSANAAGRVEVNGSQPLHLREGNIEALLRGIVAWGGPGFCAVSTHPHEGECAPRAITAEAIEALDETAERILIELQARLRTRSPDFTSPLSPPRTATAEAEPRGTGADSLSSSSSSDLAGATTNS